MSDRYFSHLGKGYNISEMAVKPIPLTEDSSYPNNLEFVPPFVAMRLSLAFPKRLYCTFLTFLNVYN